MLSYGLKLAGAAIALLTVGVGAMIILGNIWARVGLGAALVVVCGGLLLFAWRVDKKDREARAGLEDI